MIDDHAHPLPLEFSPLDLSAISLDVAKEVLDAVEDFMATVEAGARPGFAESTRLAVFEGNARAVYRLG